MRGEDIEKLALLIQKCPTFSLRLPVVEKVQFRIRLSDCVFLSWLGLILGRRPRSHRAEALRSRP